MCHRSKDELAVEEKNDMRVYIEKKKKKMMMMMIAKSIKKKKHIDTRTREREAPVRRVASVLSSFFSNVVNLAGPLSMAIRDNRRRRRCHIVLFSININPTHRSLSSSFRFISFIC
jgi:hypothetical protein